MAKLQTYVRIPRGEYTQFKKFQKYFEEFLKYLDHTGDIKRARKNIKTKRVISQEELFKELGV